EVADVGIAEHHIDIGNVAALRQPDALRPFAEMTLELASPDFDLNSDRFLVDHQREEPVRRPAGDDLQLAGLEKPAEPIDQVVAVLLDEDIASALETVVVHLGEGMELPLPAGALDLLAGQGDQVVDVPDIAILEEWIAEHAGQRRRDRHG